MNANCIHRRTELQIQAGQLATEAFSRTSKLTSEFAVGEIGAGSLLGFISSGGRVLSGITPASLHWNYKLFLKEIR